MASLYDVIVEMDEPYRKAERALRAEPNDDAARAAFNAHRMRAGDTSIESWFRGLETGRHGLADTKVNTIQLANRVWRVVTKRPEGDFFVTHSHGGRPWAPPSHSHHLIPADGQAEHRPSGRPISSEESPVYVGYQSRPATVERIQPRFPHRPETWDRPPHDAEERHEWERGHAIQAHVKAMRDESGRRAEQQKSLGGAIKQSVRKSKRRNFLSMKKEQKPVASAVTSLRRTRLSGA